MMNKPMNRGTPMRSMPATRAPVPGMSNTRRPLPPQAKTPAAAVKGMAMRAAPLAGGPKAPKAPMPMKKPLPTQAKVPAAAAKGMAMRNKGRV